MNDPDERPTAMIIHQTMTGLYSPDEEIAALLHVESYES
jgi:hypothetical protein